MYRKLKISNVNKRLLLYIVTIFSDGWMYNNGEWLPYLHIMLEVLHCKPDSLYYFNCICQVVPTLDKWRPCLGMYPNSCS